MKRATIAFLLISVLFTACKKDETPSDNTAQFVGTYNSTINVKIPALQMDQTNSRVYTFAKSPEAGKIIITDDMGGNMTATVSGNTYSYDKKTITGTLGGVIITYEITGTGSISGNTVIESGVYNVTSGDQTYPGTWSGTHIRN